MPRTPFGRLVLWTAALLAFAAIVYVFYLDRVVTHQFQGRRWTLPAQVYAAPLELYAGLPLSQADLESELQRLRYRRVERFDAHRAGTYRTQGGRLDVSLRAARFLDENRPASLLSVTTGPTGIETLRDGSEGTCRFCAWSRS